MPGAAADFRVTQAARALLSVASVTTSGLVLTLDEDPALRAAALAELARDPRISIGEPTGLRLPIATEASDLPAAEALAEALGHLDGVRFVDVVFVHFEETDHGTT